MIVHSRLAPSEFIDQPWPLLLAGLFYGHPRLNMIECSAEYLHVRIGSCTVELKMDGRNRDIIVSKHNPGPKDVWNVIDVLDDVSPWIIMAQPLAGQIAIELYMCTAETLAAR